MLTKQIRNIIVHKFRALNKVKRNFKNSNTGKTFNGFENYELLYPHFQWRTVKDQDGAFRNMPFDPQIVNIDGSTVVNLPPVFENGQRLGHNWSLKWVFDKYFEK